MKRTALKLASPAKRNGSTWPFVSTDERVTPTPTPQEDEIDERGDGCPICNGDGEVCAVCGKEQP